MKKNLAIIKDTLSNKLLKIGEYLHWIKRVLRIFKNVFHYAISVPILIMVFIIAIGAEFNPVAFANLLNEIIKEGELDKLYTFSLAFSLFISFLDMTLSFPKQKGFHCEQFGFMIEESEITNNKEDDGIYHFSFKNIDDVREALVKLLQEQYTIKNSREDSSND